MLKTKTLTQCALFTALLCVVSPIVVPIGTIPLTFSLFVLMLSAVILGPFKSTLSAVIYLLIGACGLPVFSSFTGGVGALFSLTGGYLLSYPLVTLVCAIPQKSKNPFTQTALTFLNCVLSVLLCHTLGILWYSFVSKTPLFLSTNGALLLLPFDILKALLASVLGVQIKNTLKKSLLL